MTHKKEHLIDTIEDCMQNVVYNPQFKRLCKEVHENNIMLKQIIKVINTYVANHNKENNDDFMRNVLANMISSGIDFNAIRKL